MTEAYTAIMVKSIRLAITTCFILKRPAGPVSGRCGTIPGTDIGFHDRLEP